MGGPNRCQCAPVLLPIVRPPACPHPLTPADSHAPAGLGIGGRFSDIVGALVMDSNCVRLPQQTAKKKESDKARWAREKLKREEAAAAAKGGRAAKAATQAKAKAAPKKQSGRKKKGPAPPGSCAASRVAVVAAASTCQLSVPPIPPVPRRSILEVCRHQETSICGL